MNSLAGARSKLAEARFFVGLLRRIENNQPVTTDSLDNEATYFTSALLNACYSLLEHLECQGKQALRSIAARESKSCETELENNAVAVRARNSDLYHAERGAPSRRTGLRTLVVHHAVVDGRHQEETHGGLGTARLGTTRLGAATHSRRLYVDHPISQERVWIVPRMAEHVQELEELVGHWENRIASLDTPSRPSHLDS
jgi:hypothetical protein